MDANVLSVWKEHVSKAVELGWTKGDLYAQLFGLGLRHLMCASFDPEELVSFDLEPSLKIDQEVHISASGVRKPGIRYRSQVPVRPRISTPSSVPHKEASLSQTSEVQDPFRLPRDQQPINGLFPSTPFPPGSNPCSEKISTTFLDPSTIIDHKETVASEVSTITITPKTGTKVIKSVAAKSKEPLHASIAVPKRTRKRKADGDDGYKPLSVAKRQMPTDKPKPCGRPVVWSNRRQELCETVPYYNSYEASWYHPQGNAMAMLISQDQAPRSYINTDVIITRATGGQSEDPKNKDVMIQTSSHTDDQPTVRAVMNAKLSKQAVILIGSNKCEMPVLLPYNYQVLDHYWITDVWWEKIRGFNVCKYRFERCDLSVEPWHMPSNREFHKPDFSTTCNVHVCEKCMTEFPQVYQVWLCLNHHCPAFWKLADGHEADKSTLAFNPAFINKRSHFTGKKEYSIKPELFQPSDHEALQFAYSRGGWLGFLCDQCGKCCSREDWIGWKCSCGNTHNADAPVLQAKQTNVCFDENNQLVSLTTKKLLNSKIERTIKTIGKYKVNWYEIMPDQWIIHLRSTPELNAQPNGPDQLFKEMQEAKGMKLLRRINGSMKAECAKAALTRHFAENYGLHYNYHVAQGSTPFSSAPAPVCHALQRLIWAGGVTKMDISKPFNEMLVVGYMSEGRMGYHDDGEASLGPTISTLSLGCQAVMKFRYKKKYHDPPLDFKTNVLRSEDLVLPGVPLEKERKAFLEWKESNPDVSSADQRTQFKRFKAVKLQADKKRNILNKDFVQLLLNHGDMVIMHGVDLQKYMEHQVEALGCLRFALTSRHVLPHTINPSDRHMGEVDLSAYPEYDGSKDCMLEKEK